MTSWTPQLIWRAKISALGLFFDLDRARWYQHFSEHKSSDSCENLYSRHWCHSCSKNWVEQEYECEVIESEVKRGGLRFTGKHDYKLFWFHFWQALGREPQFLHYIAHVYDSPRTLSNNTRQSCIRVTWKDWILSLWVRGSRSHFPLINHFLPHAGAYIVDCCDICSSCNFHEHVVFSLQASQLHVLAKHLCMLYTYPGR